MSDGLYCDGGVIGRNPSPLGGTWAWCLVQGGAIVDHDSGTAKNHERFATTNNFTELLAALQGLGRMPRGWRGTIFTDSLVTLRRIRKGTSFKGIPAWMKKLTIQLRTVGLWESALVGGHPTKIELEEGCRERNNLPVSRWNVWCDAECKRLAKEFMEKRDGLPGN